MQVCPHCTRSLPLDSYAPSHRGRRGSWCKACRAEYGRSQRPRTPTKPCDSCGVEIVNPRPQQRFCTPACKARAQRRRVATGEAPPEPYRKRPSRAGTQQEATCTRCGEAFWYTLKVRSRTVCDLCRTHDADWSTFRLTGAQAEALRRDAHCAICDGDQPGGRFGNWHIDHDHQTGVVRGVLCAWCNTALGLLGDSPERIDRAADYLRTHDRRANTRPVQKEPP